MLKDSDVPPVIGAGGSHWDNVDQDGTFYFPFVSQILLLEIIVIYFSSIIYLKFV